MGSVGRPALFVAQALTALSRARSLQTDTHRGFSSSQSSLLYLLLQVSFPTPPASHLLLTTLLPCIIFILFSLSFSELFGATLDEVAQLPSFLFRSRVASRGPGFRERSRLKSQHLNLRVTVTTATDRLQHHHCSRRASVRLLDCPLISKSDVRSGRSESTWSSDALAVPQP